MTTRGQAEALAAVVLVVIIVMAGFVAAVDPVSGAAGNLSATRTIDQSEVQPGASTTITLEIQVDSNQSLISVTETFNPAFQSVDTPTVTYEGGTGTTVATRTSSNSVNIAASNVTAGTTMVVTYDVTAVYSAGTTHTITGKVTAGNLSIPPSGASQLSIALSGGATFDASAKEVQEEHGDVAAIPITFGNVNQATLVLGSRELGYLVRLKITDGNGDGNATVRWNTHLARQTDDASDAFTAAGALDTVTNVERLQGEEFSIPEQRIGTTVYPMNLTVAGTETDVGTVSVVDAGTVNRSLYVTRASGSFGVDAVPGNVKADTASPEETLILMEGDWVVLTIRTGGIHGYINSADNLSEGKQGVALSVDETGSETDTVALDNFTYVDRAASNEILLIADTGSRDFNLNSAYQATFSINATRNPYVDDPVRLSTQFIIMYPASAEVALVGLLVALLVAIPIGRLRIGE